MALQLRKGTDAQRILVTFLIGEPVWTTDNKELWVGDGVTPGGIFVGGVKIVDTIVNAELQGGAISLLYVEQTETIYRYVPLGAAYVDDNLYILSTADGGNTRWVGIAGKYVRIDDISQWAITNFRGTNTEIIESAELLTNPDFSTGTFAGWVAGANWAVVGNAAVHSIGSAATLQQNVVAVIGNWYYVQFDINAINGGAISLSFGGVSLGTFDFTVDDYAVIIQAVSTAGLIITPAFSGTCTLDNFILRSLTLADSVINVRHSDNTIASQIYSGGTGNDNTLLGKEAGRFSGAVSSQNTAIGLYALSKGYRSVNNVAIGTGAMQNASGQNVARNVAIGVSTLNVLRQGEKNVGIGEFNLLSLRKGSFNTIIGNGAGQNLINADGNVFVGYLAGELETGNNKLYIANSGTTNPLIYGDFALAQLIINGDLSTKTESILAYNNSGGNLNQFRIVRSSGYNVGTGVTEINYISSYTQIPIGIISTTLATTNRGNILKRGVLTITGFDTTLSAVGNSVYCDNTGTLTLTKTKYKIGVVLTLSANGVIYVNLGGGSSGAIDIIDTVAIAEGMFGIDNDLIYVVETETFYRYEATGGAYTDDNTFVLSTANGGNTRWLAISGKYVIQDINFYNNIYVNGRVNKESTGIEVYNDTGGVLAQYKIVEATGVNGNRPTINNLSNVNNRPIGMISTAIPDATAGYVLKQGTIQVTGFDTTLSAVGNKVYSNASGDLTLLSTGAEVGVVLTLNTNGTIYINIGGAGGGSPPTPSGTPLAVRLAGADIDGAINLINTNISLYTVPALSSALKGSVVISNRNNAVITVRLAHVDGAIGSVVNADYILYDTSFVPYETKTIEIPGMSAGDSLLIRSDTINVNFKFSAYETAIIESIKRISAYNIAVADTNEQVVALISSTANLKYYITNKSLITSCLVRVALIDGALGALSNEDYSLYDETLLGGETRSYDLGEGLLAGSTIMIRSTDINTNIVIYGEEY